MHTSTSRQLKIVFFQTGDFVLPTSSDTGFFEVTLLETLKILDVNQEINYECVLNSLQFKTHALFDEEAARYTEDEVGSLCDSESHV